MAISSTLGRGPTWPFRRIGSDFDQAEGVPLVEASLIEIAQTPKGSIPWFQEFGTNLDRMRHRPMSTELLAEAEQDVREAWQRFEPRAEIREVEIRKLDTPKQGFQIRALWAPVAKPGSRNIVVPKDQLLEVKI